MRVFRPLDATEEIFWICVGVLRDNGTASIYQLRYLIGNDTVPFLEVEHPSDERYEPYVDMDLVDGVDECRTVLLTDDVRFLYSIQLNRYYNYHNDIVTTLQERKYR